MRNCSPALGYACRSELARESHSEPRNPHVGHHPHDSRASSLLPHPTTLVNGYDNANIYKNIFRYFSKSYLILVK
jgi:hypothetical protein